MHANFQLSLGAVRVVGKIYASEHVSPLLGEHWRRTASSPGCILSTYSFLLLVIIIVCLSFILVSV